MTHWQKGEEGREGMGSTSPVGGSRETHRPFWTWPNAKLCILDFLLSKMKGKVVKVMAEVGPRLYCEEKEGLGSGEQSLPQAH
jgi:hypothetical protein